MFYNQPLGARFGTELISHLASGNWQSLDVAVAWVRASAMKHLGSSLASFLAAGGRLRLIVGVDLDNTSREGLQAALDLEKYGDAATTIYHNESNTIFHPKLYLFRNASCAKLIVGSNNLTEAGLYTNTEAGLEIEAALNSDVIKEAVGVLASWSDGSLGLSKPLTPAFLADLVAAGYVKDEAVVRGEMLARRKAAKASAANAKRLFNSVPVTSPASPAQGAMPAAPQATPGTNVVAQKTLTAPIAPPASGQVLLMRLRKAHPIHRATQTQIPLEVARSSFFKGISFVTSAHDGQAHEIRAAVARGIVNTLKLEIPEMKSMKDPVARFERSGPTSIHYQVYDRATPKGAAIMSSLEAGRNVTPQVTRLTVPSAPASATWWRFI